MDIIRYIEKQTDNIVETSTEELAEALCKVAEQSLEISPIVTGRLRNSYRIKVNGVTRGLGNRDKTVLRIQNKIPIEKEIEGVISVEAESDEGYRYPLLVHEITAKTGKLYFLQIPFGQSKKDIVKAMTLRGDKT